MVADASVSGSAAGTGEKLKRDEIWRRHGGSSGDGSATST